MKNDLLDTMDTSAPFHWRILHHILEKRRQAITQLNTDSPRYTGYLLAHATLGELRGRRIRQIVELIERFSRPIDSQDGLILRARQSAAQETQRILKTLLREEAKAQTTSRKRGETRLRFLGLTSHSWMRWLKVSRIKLSQLQIEQRDADIGSLDPLMAHSLSTLIRFFERALCQKGLLSQDDLKKAHMKGDQSTALSHGKKYYWLIVSQGLQAELEIEKSREMDGPYCDAASHLGKLVSFFKHNARPYVRAAQRPESKAKTKPVNQCAS